ncbi:hypothetical protein FQR65_LT18742 [Abscondita terminalis]|nr:hypothetical protein FQR65_LT18742 [Abscondita terminalis]
MMNRYASSLASPLLDTDYSSPRGGPGGADKMVKHVDDNRPGRKYKMHAKSNGNMNEKFKKEDTAQKTLDIQCGTM